MADLCLGQGRERESNKTFKYTRLIKLLMCRVLIDV
jgi:hypothetical protein